MKRPKNMGTYTGIVERHGSSVSYTLEYTQTLYSGIYGERNSGFDIMIAQYHTEFARRIENELSRFLDTRPPVSASCRSYSLVMRQGDSGITFAIRPYDKEQIIIGSDTFGSLRMLEAYILSVKQQYSSIYVWNDKESDITSEFHITDVDYQDGTISVTCKGKRDDKPIVLMYVIENIPPAGSTNFSAADIKVHLPAGVRKNKANEKIYIETFLEHLLIMS